MGKGLHSVELPFIVRKESVWSIAMNLARISFPDVIVHPSSDMYTLPFAIRGPLEAVDMCEHNHTNRDLSPRTNLSRDSRQGFDFAFLVGMVLEQSQSWLQCCKVMDLQL